MSKRKQRRDDALREQVGIAATRAHAKKIFDEHDRRMREHRRSPAQFMYERHATLNEDDRWLKGWPRV